ncbi:MAG: phosphate acyltransferase PlsX [Phycisphaeraceae bacterium]|nr:phosphate acyltransferase PlsX [Phycisphaeraceae bacterium]MBX3366271.1 phosphate acyltransferase PlsX [Phycisphaeraceae bacterium]
MRLAVDVMGGDHAPDAILRGCVDALPDLGDGDRLVLVGPSDIIVDYLKERRVKDDRVSIEHASEVIAMDDTPAMAVRTKRDSSIVKMSILGSHKADQPCDAVLSAGNTGACVAAAIMHMKRLPHVHRPGIAVTIPAFHGPLVLCDAGANPEPKGVHLWQYGVMCQALAQHMLKIASPRVALMNIGSEEAKGSELVKEARNLLRKTPGLNYIGYVEGRDFFDGVADVIVTDGFVGNSMLKMAEGMGSAMMKAIVSEVFSIDPDLGMQLEPVLKQIYKKNDYHEYGGAPLMGVNGVCMIAHGSSQPRTIRAAIRNTFQYVAAGVNEVIVKRLGEVADVAHGAVAPVAGQEHA